MSKVLITGGKGLIGRPLTQLLLENNHEVVHVSRSPSKDDKIKTYCWDLDRMQLDKDALQGVDVIIHLAGAGIVDKPWTEERKKEILTSRTQGASLLKETCENENIRLKSFISASAIGWYPLIISDKIYTEDNEPGSGFLSNVCVAWEKSADEFSSIANHVSKVRIGIVLAKEGGALPQMTLPIKRYIGAPIGVGTQAMPWIHSKDVCNIFLHIMEKELSGVYNAVGPENATNEEFMQTIADVIDKPMLLPNVPEFLIKLLLGGKADLITKGVRVSSDRIKAEGFLYEFPTLNTALGDIYFGKD